MSINTVVGDTILTNITRITTEKKSQVIQWSCSSVRYLNVGRKNKNEREVKKEALINRFIYYLQINIWSTVNFAHYSLVNYIVPLRIIFFDVCYAQKDPGQWILCTHNNKKKREIIIIVEMVCIIASWRQRHEAHTNIALWPRSKRAHMWQKRHTGIHLHTTSE